MGQGVVDRPAGSGDWSSYACETRIDADDERNALDEPDPYEGRRRVLCARRTAVAALDTGDPGREPSAPSDGECRRGEEGVSSGMVGSDTSGDRSSRSRR